MTLDRSFVILIYLMTTTTDPSQARPLAEHGPDSPLSAEIVAWIEAEAGHPVTSVTRVAAGGRRLGFAVDLAGADSTRGLYLAMEPGDATAGDRPSGLRREFHVYQRLARDGIRVPPVLALHPTIDAMLMEHVPGHARYGSIGDTATKVAVARDFMACLATAHLVDPWDDPVPGLEPHGSIRRHLTEFVDGWAERYRSGRNGPDPLLEHGLRWLRSRMPDPDRRLAIVQGDTGPGNFMFDGDRVTAIVDWELSHLGDPFEDLGWLSMRAAQDPFPDLALRLQEYADALGEELDLDAVRYYRVLAEWTIALIGHLKSRAGLGDSERGNAFVFEQLHRRLLIEALAEADGETLPDLPGIRFADTDRTWVYDMALDQQRVSVVPHLDDPLAVRRAKGVARTLKWLKQADRAGGEPVERERQALQALLGTAVGDLTAARLEVVRGIREDRWSKADQRAYLWLKTWLDNEVCGEAMGRLRDRHLDPLTQPADGGAS
ncbi:phosphotransferase family protein [Streptomyces mexicanus]|jgi:aminoglycoside phosphotransferase (APT) family kinase protein|uniref:Phosphotransferase family protein n=1 Tax=Streptomyces mexicanus TaxID=178566 RepID=A0A7X1HXQ5_9ACTN|nr:phosphotransferase family protein [Streptomyces mexicanus]MBC2864959.1 phosphotransferase family protein [Streptomyces mexicanus]